MGVAPRLPIVRSAWFPCLAFELPRATSLAYGVGGASPGFFPGLASLDGVVWSPEPRAAVHAAAVFFCFHWFLFGVESAAQEIESSSADGTNVER